MRLLPISQYVQLNLKGFPINDFGRAKFTSHDVFHRPLPYQTSALTRSFSSFFVAPSSSGSLRVGYNIHPLRVRRGLGIIVVVPVPPLVRRGLGITLG